MVRNCGAALALWFVLAGIYLYVLWRELPMPMVAGVAAIMATAVWIGLMWLNAARRQFGDWQARNRLARGERPQDGELAVAVGPIHVVFEPLHAPMSGRPCAIYSYEIGLVMPGSSHARDYIGFGMTRCSVRTAYGEYFLGSFPALEGFPKEEGDRKLAVQYVASTTFEDLSDIPTLVKRTVGLHTQPPPVRVDWKYGDPVTPVDAAEVLEQVVEPGDIVTATGRYVSGSNAIVSDTGDKGFVRLRRGGTPPHEEGLPLRVIGSVLGGILIVAIANAILWYFLTMR